MARTEDSVLADTSQTAMLFLFCTKVTCARILPLRNLDCLPCTDLPTRERLYAYPMLTGQVDDYREKTDWKLERMLPDSETGAKEVVGVTFWESEDASISDSKHWSSLLQKLPSGSRVSWFLNLIYILGPSGPDLCADASRYQRPWARPALAGALAPPRSGLKHQIPISTN